MQKSTLLGYFLTLLLGTGLLGLSTQQVRAQTYQMPTAGTTSYTTCSGTLYDNGGPNGTYATSADGTVTLTPATAGNKIRLDFTSFLTESYADVLYIYDGTSTAATLIGTYSGNTSPGTVYATTSSGALTVRFATDYSVEYSGFAASVSCVTSIPQADLTVQAATVGPTNTVAGNVVAASSQIYNLSGGTAPSSNLGYYLSTDNTLSSNDTFLTSSTGGSLSVGQSSPRYSNLTIPAGTAAGTYYILFAADYLGQVSETNETNNVASVGITVQASSVDLLIQNATVSPASAGVGSAIYFSSYIYNQGNAPAANSSVGFYLSADATLDANDELLTSQYGGTLSALTAGQRTGTTTVPAGTAAGNYYILVVADYQNQVTESSETNNVSALSFTVVPPGPDLIITQPSLYNTYVSAGTAVTASAYVSNQGNQSASSSAMGLYLSTNTTFDANDQLLTTSAGTALAAGTSSYRSVSFTVPTATATGTYYVLFVADPAGAVAESIETNNVTSYSLYVYAATVDLSVSSLSVSPTQTLAGNTISASCYLYNQGNAPANPATVGYYLSTDNVFSNNDVLIGNASATTVNGNDYLYRTGSATVPAGTPAGTYYVFFVADYLNQLTETNENNNISSTSISVVAPGIDLYIYSPYASPTQVYAGGSISTSGYLYNQGTVSTSAATVGYYLSTDNSLSSNDVLIGSNAATTVGAGSYVSLYGTATVPAGTAAGTYYVLFAADYLGQVSETNETNNVASTSIQVVVPTIDLTLGSLSVSPSQTAAGTTISASCYLYNQGNSLANPATIGYYFSTDNVFSSNDVLIGNSSGSVSGNNYTYRTGSATVPAGTAAGTYYVFFVADYLNQLAETNENNNSSYSTIQVVVPYIDLALYSAYLSQSQVVAGSAVNSTCILYNAGNNPASPATVGYYLSTDNALSSNDVLIGNSSLNALAGGANTYLYGTPTVPATTAAGTYYVLFVADYLNQLTESNKTNNLVYTTLQVTANSADLTLQSPQLASSTVNPGTSLNASCYIYNKGTAAASGSTLGIYLSTNATFDSSDVLLSTNAGGALAAGSSSYRSGAVTIPAATTAGTYYVLFVADPAGDVTESDRSNNVASLTLVVTGPFTGTVVPASGAATLTTCSGRIYDNGGTSNYANNSNGTLTIFPGTAGAAVRLSFVSFEIEQVYDFLTIYDGPNTSARVLGTFSGYFPLGSFTASAGNTTGALTVQFSSNSTTTAPGFEAVVSCVQPLANRDQTAGYEVSVVPNPVAGAAPLRVELSGLGATCAATLSLRNSLGQLVASQPLALAPSRRNQAEIPTQGLATGVYILQLTGPNLNVVRRIVVE